MCNACSALFRHILKDVKVLPSILRWAVRKNVNSWMFKPDFSHLQFNLYRKGDRLVGLVVRRPPRERKAPGFFRGRVIPVTSKLALQWLPCQAPGVIGSALGLVGPVSVYCDWVRWKVGSAASISVWQHVKLSLQIRP